eukprot:scaffold3340_cov255-Pinguiococcus_pyrenoidosus.AAC.23
MAKCISWTCVSAILCMTAIPRWEQVTNPSRQAVIWRLDCLIRPQCTTGTWASFSAANARWLPCVAERAFMQDAVIHEK